ncbi:hypothetical protein ABQE70_16020 [Xanthomonas campestris pv. campestris]|uniref:hypothetical protein n=1 Tax=Xanthomonas campestris TaxID=339 RepID=UPI0023685CF7|nr:hypothetical protein [Xanthomonas campestris]MEA9730210.1 hypothetical protein [Xanthomonas campestris]WDJ84129.1 hypothetical protein JH279_15970 [Xanthomonas campestris pv. incanae]WDJ92910.1 hypothetical protein JH260_15420 [Xanthomonas campestris pv. incanae]WDJ97121.1 hypothetical protein JH262_16155 [Xanthomonas campestris pv. incanae]WDK26770.1 hypothetical protein JH274_05540 [Xanthomonas campestris pv. incanae]
MKRSLLLLATLLATGSALAQTGDSGTDAVTPHSLDLSIPKEPVQYRSDPEYSTDPPGTFYGDKTGPQPALARSSAASIAAERAEQCQGKLHGAVETGMGYSNRGGNSNWQAVNLNSCKTYYDDDGKAHQIGVSISVGRGEGPIFGPRYAPGGYGPGPFGW